MYCQHIVRSFCTSLLTEVLGFLMNNPWARSLLQILPHLHNICVSQTYSNVPAAGKSNVSLAPACYQLAYNRKVTRSESSVPKFTFCFMRSVFYKKLKVNVMTLIKLWKNCCFSQHILRKVITVPSQCCNQQSRKEMIISHFIMQYLSAQSWALTQNRQTGRDDPDSG